MRRPPRYAAPGRAAAALAVMAAAGLGTPGTAAAASEAGAGVRATVRLEPAEVYLGSPARLTVEVRGPGDLALDVAALGEALGRLPGAAPAAQQRREEAGGVVVTRAVSLTRFELGGGPGETCRIPYRAGGEAGELELWLPQPEVVDVPAREGDSEDGLRAAKGTVEARPGRGPWALGLAALAALGLFAWIRRRPAPVIAAAPVPAEPPADRALRLLAGLEREGDGGDPRSYHYRLSEVVREYLVARYGLPGLSETTYELVGDCRAAALEPGVVGRVEGLLGSLDLVKFGPDEVASTRSSEHLVRCQDLVRSTMPAATAAPTSRSGRPAAPGEGGRG